MNKVIYIVPQNEENITEGNIRVGKILDALRSESHLGEDEILVLATDIEVHSRYVSSFRTAFSKLCYIYLEKCDLEAMHLYSVCIPNIHKIVILCKPEDISGVYRKFSAKDAEYPPPDISEIEVGVIDFSLSERIYKGVI